MQQVSLPSAPNAANVKVAERAGVGRGVIRELSSPRGEN